MLRMCGRQSSGSARYTLSQMLGLHSYPYKTMEPVGSVGGDGDDGGGDGDGGSDGGNGGSGGRGDDGGGADGKGASEKLALPSE